MLIDTRSRLSASTSPLPPQRAMRHVSISSDHATALMEPPPVADDMRFERTHPPCSFLLFKLLARKRHASLMAQ